MPEGKQGRMNIDFSETYDQEGDTYYVTFKTGEPSYCVEVDDIVLLELGLFTHLPTGFRILNFSKNKPTAVQIKVTLRRTLESVATPSREERQAAVEEALEKVLA